MSLNLKIQDGVECLVCARLMLLIFCSLRSKTQLNAKNSGDFLNIFYGYVSICTA